ncbi:MAG: hypothetical protein JXB26_04585 [Candidatus Aminicenantes bacterium]|nr:hypothetical protein [Candidatus Aminicenantes bacterium]
MENVRQKRHLKKIIFCLLPLFLWNPHLFAQEDELRGRAPNVYIDCGRRICDKNYIRTEITFVNYMNDRQNADIHVLITRQRTGSGGFEYTMRFIGLKRNKGKDATLKYYSKSTDTEDEIRQGMVNILKQGLIPYLADTPLAEYISVSYEKTAATAEPTPLIDKWNHWIFSLGLRGNVEMEDLSKEYNYSVSLSANRTTENWKFRFWANAEFDKEQYKIDKTEEIESETDSKTLYTQLVKSLTGHMSAGLFVHVYSSTYDNADLFFTAGPGVEFNIFPYSESTRRELRIQYRLNFTYRNYNELTVYNKLKENLFKQIFEVILEFKETWGSAGLRFVGSNYFHDFSKNNFRLDAGLSLRIIRGLSLNLDAEYSRVRDQLSLPFEGASKEEILLQLKELATGYSFELRLGFSYRFGSIYNNVVNPRFGNR